MMNIRALHLSRWAFLAALVCSGTGACTGDEPIARFSTTVFGSTIPNDGLRGQVYELLQGMNYLPYFTTMKPVATLYTKSLNIAPQDFSRGFPGLPNLTEWFAIDYQATIWISEPGKYRFQLMSDDGSKLYIDEIQIISNDGVHPPRTMEAEVTLKRGSHPIRISYFQGPRFQLALVFSVARPADHTFRIFNTDDFKPPEAKHSNSDKQVK
jgi:PA14 domain